MKKIIICILLILCCSMTTKCSNEDKNAESIEERTYMNVTYERAYYLSKKDGLRARAHIYYLISEDDGKILQFIELTAGEGKYTVLEGTYVGSLDKEINCTFTRKNGTNNIENLFFIDKQMFDDDNEKFSQTSILETIKKIKNSH